MKFILLLLMSLFLAGCNWFLPSGTPPEGNILQNPVPTVMSVNNYAEAIDYFISSLTMALLEKCPGENICLAGSGDVYSSNAAMVVLRESGKISGNKTVYGKNTDWQLHSSQADGLITLTLLYRDNAVWSDSVMLRGDGGQSKLN